MRSVWLCSRNDVIGNFAVLLAALGVFGTGTGWPDVIVASMMATLALQGSLACRSASIRVNSARREHDPKTCCTSCLTRNSRAVAQERPNFRCLI